MKLARPFVPPPRPWDSPTIRHHRSRADRRRRFVLDPKAADRRHDTADERPNTADRRYETTDRRCA